MDLLMPIGFRDVVIPQFVDAIGYNEFVISLQY